MAIPPPVQQAGSVCAESMSKTLTGLKLSKVKLSKIKPYPENPRVISDRAIEAVVKSLKTFGWQQPLVLNAEQVIGVGHTRFLSAQKIHSEGGSIPNWPDTSVAPVFYANDLTPEEFKAYRIADNKTGEITDWEFPTLALEMTALQNDGFDLSLIGFDENELANIFADPTAGLTDPDQVPEIPDEPITKTGDVWVLGNHRLMCGDSTIEAHVSALLAGVQPHLMVTDPPYGVEYDPTWRAGSEKRTYMAPEDDTEQVWSGVWSLFPGDVAYIWHGDKQMLPLYQEMEKQGFEARAQIIWNKMRFIIGRGHYCYNHEACFYGVRKKKTAHWVGGNNNPTVWDINHRASGTNHGAQKPVECMKRPIENNSSPGQAVYEPFSGSGTTIIAGEMTSRAIYAMELNPAYVDVAVQRWQDFTGEQAKLEDNGEYFPSIKKHGAKKEDSKKEDSGESGI